MQATIDRLDAFIAEAYVDEDLVAYNTDLAKKIKGVKRDLGVKTIKQGYKGTGGQKHRRQVWLRWEDGSVVDVWLDDGFFRFGGIVSQVGGREVQVSPRQIDYDGKPVDTIYREVVTALQAWRSLAETPKVAKTKDVEKTAPKKTKTDIPVVKPALRKSEKFAVGDTITIVYQQARGAGNKTATVRVADMDPYGGGMSYGVHSVKGKQGRGGVLHIDAQGHTEFQPRMPGKPYPVVSVKPGKPAPKAVDERVYNPEKLKLTDRAKAWLSGAETVRKGHYAIRRDGDGYSLTGPRAKYVGIRNKHDGKIRFIERVVSKVRITDRGGTVDLWSA